MAEPAEHQSRQGQPTDDLVLAFRTLNSRAQGRVVRLGASVDDILGRHQYPDPVSELLGEALALACGNKFCSIGSENAAVLPVPVWAPAIKSRPNKASGIACAWIGVGVW